MLNPLSAEEVTRCTAEGFLSMILKHQELNPAPPREIKNVVEETEKCAICIPDIPAELDHDHLHYETMS